MTTTPLHITIEVEPATDSPAGVVTAGGATFPFTGWIGLLAVLDSLIGTGAEDEVAAGRSVGHEPPEQRKRQ